MMCVCVLVYDHAVYLCACGLCVFVRVCTVHVIESTRPCTGLSDVVYVSTKLVMAALAKYTCTLHTRL